MSGLFEAVFCAIGAFICIVCVVYTLFTVLFRLDDATRQSLERLAKYDNEVPQLRIRLDDAMDQNAWLRTELEAQKRITASMARHPAYVTAEANAQVRPLRPSLRKRERAKSPAESSSPGEGGEEL